MPDHAGYQGEVQIWGSRGGARPITKHGTGSSQRCVCSRKEFLSTHRPARGTSDQALPRRCSHAQPTYMGGGGGASRGSDRSGQAHYLFLWVPRKKKGEEKNQKQGSRGAPQFPVDPSKMGRIMIKGALAYALLNTPAAAPRRATPAALPWPPASSSSPSAAAVVRPLSFLGAYSERRHPSAAAPARSSPPSLYPARVRPCTLAFDRWGVEEHRG